MVRNIFFTLIGFILLAQFYTANLFNVIFVLCGVVAYFYNRHNVNIYSLLLVLVALRTLEILAFSIFDSREAYVVYPTYILLDTVALYAISTRNKYLAKWEYRRTGQINVEQFVFTNADYLLQWIYRFYLLLVILTFGEHILRHLEDFGLPQSWSDTNLLFFHGIHGGTKLVLNIVEFVAILATASRHLHSGRFVQA